MKNCRKIQQELSAYLDGELTSSLRAEVEAHLVSCARCQQELLEMKMLATGVAALPNLKPAPRFLSEVRRKIARDVKPEPINWQDYIFRPFWLKVPLEVAAVIVIIALVMRTTRPLPMEKARLQLAKAETGVNAQKDVVSSATPLDAQGRSAESARAREVPEAEGTGVGAAGSPNLANTGDKKQLLDRSAASGMTAGDVGSQSLGGATRIPMSHGSDELSVSPPSSLSTVGSANRSMEFDQSKVGETITVHALDVDDVRSRAQRLAARCNGRIVVVPQLKDAAEQNFFVELPREYVAAFKVELLKTSGPSATLAGGVTAQQSDSKSAGAPSSGVLTGNAVTNNSINAPGSFGLRDDTTATAPTAVLEIQVVPPAN